MRRAIPVFRILAVFAALSAAADARAVTIDRDPLPAASVRRFSVPAIGALSGGPDGRLYARASDRIPDGSRLPRRFWWTRAPGQKRWTLIAGQPSGYDTWVVAPDPVHAGVVYAVTPGGRVLRSEDGGSTWMERGSVPGPPQQLLVTATDLLIVGSSGACAPCHSGDGGQTWERWTVAGDTLVPAPSDPRIFYAFWPGQIRRSTDGGRSFSDVSPAELEGAGALAVAPSDADVVYALSSVLNGFLSRTRDGGASWSRLVPPSPGLTWSGPAVDPASPSHLFVLGGPADLSAPRRLFESLDGGESWTRHAGAVNATELRIADPGKIQAFGRRGIFVSEDRGEHWVQEDAGITADAELLLAGAGNGDLYLTVQDGGATWSSRDAGRTWERRGTIPGFQPFFFASLAVDPFDPLKLLAFGDPRGLWWSDDGGRTWAFRKGPRTRKGSAYINTVVLDPHRKDTVYASTTEDAWRSGDRGATWSRFTASLPSGTDCNHSGCFEIRDVEAIVPDPFDPLRFYAVAHTYGFYRTRDGGTTWKWTQSPALAASAAPFLRPDPSVRGRLYWGLIVETQVYQSDRSALPPWKTLLKTGAIGPVFSDSWLTFDPRGRLVVQPETHRARILRRLGEDWERIPVALEHQEDVRLLDPLVPAPGGGTRMFFLVPGLGLFRADLPEPP